MLASQWVAKVLGKRPLHNDAYVCIYINYTCVNTLYIYTHMYFIYIYHRGSTIVLYLVYLLHRLQPRFPEFNWNKLKSFCAKHKFSLKMSFRHQIRAPALACDSSQTSGDNGSWSRNIAAIRMTMSTINNTSND